jgi:hypothetical protein
MARLGAMTHDTGTGRTQRCVSLAAAAVGYRY